MDRRFAIAASVALLLISSSALARSKQYPRVTIVLPEGVPSEKVVVQYVLYGSFGGSGGYVRSKPDSRFVEILASVGEKAADQIRIFMWAPGCKIATFEIPLHESSDIHETFLCAFLPNINLEGQIRSPELLTKKYAEVSVTYLAEWSCRFFGFADCMVPQIQLGTARPDADGFFEIEIPDFGADPIAGHSIEAAELDLILRDAKTWNRLAMLEPESEKLKTLGHGLKILLSYPRDLAFVERRPTDMVAFNICRDMVEPGISQAPR